MLTVYFYCSVRVSESVSGQTFVRAVIFNCNRLNGEFHSRFVLFGDKLFRFVFFSWKLKHENILQTHLRLMSDDKRFYNIIIFVFVKYLLNYYFEQENRDWKKKKQNVYNLKKT